MKKIFEDAKNEGEEMGLQERSTSARDVFRIALGDIPAGEKAVVEIGYSWRINDGRRQCDQVNHPD